MATFMALYTTFYQQKDLSKENISTVINVAQPQKYAIIVQCTNWDNIATEKITRTLFMQITHMLNLLVCEVGIQFSPVRTTVRLENVTTRSYASNTRPHRCREEPDPNLNRKCHRTNKNPLSQTKHQTCWKWQCAI